MNRSVLQRKWLMVKGSNQLVVVLCLSVLCNVGAGCGDSNAEVGSVKRADAGIAEQPSDLPRITPPAANGGASPAGGPKQAANGGNAAPRTEVPAGRAAMGGGITTPPSAAGRGGSTAAAGRSAPQTTGGTRSDSCPGEYTVATHITMNVNWVSSLAVTAGKGQVHIWSKSRFSPSDSGQNVESRSCGSVLPVITTSAIAGSKKILPEIPDNAWDSTSMPTFTGTATRKGGVLTVSPGVALIGLTLDVPTGPWPAVSGVVGIDHDGDGALGLTAIPREGGEFVTPPTSIAQITRADKLYLAIRNIMTLTSMVDGCLDSYSGTANVTNFESHIIGCHVKGGGECTTTQRDFVDSNRTIYNVDQALFAAQRVDAAATCADIRALLPVQ
jgi:hypothetical protein